MTSRPTADLRSFDRGLLAMLVILLVGFSASSFRSYAKRSHFAFCHTEQRVESLKELERQHVLFLPAPDFERLRRSDGASLALLRDSAGSVVETLQLHSNPGEVRLRTLGAEGISISTVRPMVGSESCQAGSLSLELVWPKRSLVAWMIPGLRTHKV